MMEDLLVLASMISDIFGNPVQRAFSLIIDKIESHQVSGGFIPVLCFTSAITRSAVILGGVSPTITVRGGCKAHLK